MTKNTLSIDVGARLRQLRAERGVSMRYLARASGLSANALSMIERGLTSPSVSTLSKISGALQVPITAFFRLEQDRQEVVLTRAAERGQAPFPGGLSQSLGGEHYVGRLESFIFILEAGVRSGEQPTIHTGHEMIYALTGSFEVEILETIYKLEPGDSLIFAGHLPHRWYNPGTEAAQVLIMVAAYDEGEKPEEYHLAAMYKIEAAPSE